MVRYSISTVSEWNSFSDSTTFTSNDYIDLMADLVFTSSPTKKIDLDAGIFDGGGYTITIPNISSFTGLFSSSNGVIKNLIVSVHSSATLLSTKGWVVDGNCTLRRIECNGNVTTTGSGCLASSAFNSGTAEYCKITGTISGAQSGGVRGHNTSDGHFSGTVRYSVFSGTSSGSQSGGFIGRCSESCTIQYCACINSTVNTGSSAIVGTLFISTTGSYTQISNCYANTGPLIYTLFADVNTVTITVKDSYTFGYCVDTSLSSTRTGLTLTVDDCVTNSGYILSNVDWTLNTTGNSSNDISDIYSGILSAWDTNIWSSETNNYPKLKIFNNINPSDGSSISPTNWSVYTTYNTAPTLDSTGGLPVPEGITVSGVTDTSFSLSWTVPSTDRGVDNSFIVIKPSTITETPTNGDTYVAIYPTNNGDIAVYGTLTNIYKTQFTIAVWVRCPEVGDEGLFPNERPGIIIGNYLNSSSKPNFNVEIDSTGYPRMWIQSSSQVYDLSASTDIRDGDWHHVVFQQSSTNRTIWVDNSSTTTTPAPGALTMTLSNYFMRDGRTSVPFHGSLGGIAIWSTALSSSDITDLYNGGRNSSEYDIGTEHSTNITNYWKMDEESGSTLDDDIGTNDITLVGSSMWDSTVYNTGDELGNGCFVINNSTSTTSTLTVLGYETVYHIKGYSMDISNVSYYTDVPVSATNNPISTTTACVMEGSHILTINGPIKIEKLKRTDKILDGQLKERNIKKILRFPIFKTEKIAILPKNTFGNNRPVDDIHIKSCHPITDIMPNALVSLNDITFIRDRKFRLKNDVSMKRVITFQKKYPTIKINLVNSGFLYNMVLVPGINLSNTFITEGVIVESIPIDSKFAK